MLWSVLLQFSLLAHGDTYYHKETAVRPILDKARAIRNHTMQEQTKTTLQRVYNNLNAREIEAMRTKGLNLVKTHTDKKYYEIENETLHELLHFYIEAIKQIPGAQVTTNFIRKPTPRPARDFLGRTLPQTPALSLTENTDAKAFRVFGSSIEFTIDNKLYRIRPSLFGKTSMYLMSPDAVKYQAAYDRCYRVKEDEVVKGREKNCDDIKEARDLEYRVRNKNFKIPNDQMQFHVTPSFDTKGNGSVRLADDKITNSAFTAASTEADFTHTYYINGDPVEYQFSDAHLAEIDQIQKETASPSTSNPVAPSRGSN